MADGYDKALTVLVEDEAAKIMLSEILRHVDDAFARTVGIVIAGSSGSSGRPKSAGKDAIRNTLISLRQATHLNIAAVLDGEEEEDIKHYIFKLPGGVPPEEAIFRCEAVRKFLADTYSEIDISALENELRDVDCHDYFKHIGRIVNCEEAFLIRESARQYVPHSGASHINTLVELLKDAASKNTARSKP